MGEPSAFNPTLYGEFYLVLVGAFHFEQMGNAGNNMESAVRNLCFRESVAMFIDQDEAGDILYIIMKKLHQQNQTNSTHFLFEDFSSHKKKPKLHRYALDKKKSRQHTSASSSSMEAYF